MVFDGIMMIYITANYIDFLQEFNLFMQVIEFNNNTSNNIPLGFFSDQMYRFDCISTFRGLHNVALKIYVTPS